MANELETAIAEYKLRAEGHGNATMEGDSKQANLCHDRLVDLLGQIRQFGIEGQKALLALTEDENQSVRSWAATHSLRFDKKKAVKALKKLAKEKGIVAFSAEMVLKELKKGTLQIP